MMEIINYSFMYFHKFNLFPIYQNINAGIRASLCTPRLIPQALKLTTMQVFNGSEICGIQINDF